MKNISDLPKDMVEEILCRIPLSSTRTIRFTCKKWNNLFKDGNFTKKHLLVQQAASREGGKFMAIMLINFDIFLMSFDLRGIYNNDSDDAPPFITPKSKLINLDDSYKVDISRVCHCDGLLLCTTRDYTRLVVWNPYTGQTRSFCDEPPIVRRFEGCFGYALGYDKSKSIRTYKILRFVISTDRLVHKILDLNSNSWRVLDVNPHWRIIFTRHGVSLKGNTYWLSYGIEYQSDIYLICFDFTTELFKPNLPLPFVTYFKHAVIMSSLREEKLALLFQPRSTFEMEIWVTTKIDPDAVLWSKFFTININSFRDIVWRNLRVCEGERFLIDEKRKIVIVYDRLSCSHNIVYIIGENGYFKKMDLGELPNVLHEIHLLACSYFPSSVQINQPV